MSYPRKIFPLPLRSLNFAALVGGYIPIGNPAESPVRIAKFYNNMNKAVLVSWDGSTDHMFLPSGSFTLLDISTNRIREDGYFIAQGQQFYVQDAGVAPTSGDIYVELYAGAP